MRVPAPLLLLLLLAPGCTTVKLKSPVAAPAVARVAQAETLWRVIDGARDGGETLGFVVYFRSQSAVEDSIYVVRNRWHQDLGMIDGHGRAYRYRPHQAEAQWVGSGTISQGALRILSAPASSELVEDSISNVPRVRAATSARGAQVRHEPRATSAANEGSS